jgi:N6-adenosine-specific RNA methylase IME4
MTTFTNFDDILASGKKYKIIYADPPWSYGCFNNINRRLFFSKRSRFGITPYSGMEIDEIKKLPVPTISEKNALLFIWVTFPILPQGLETIQAWGFKYTTIAFNWVKKNRNATGWYMGLGNYTRANSEICLIGKKGKGLPVLSHAVPQILDMPLSEHSEKPDEARKRIIQLVGDLPRIELFARTKIHGWDTFGNDQKLELEPLEFFT